MKEGENMLVIKKPKKELTIDRNSKTHLVNIILSLFGYLKKYKNEVLICAMIDKNFNLLEVDIVNEGTKDKVDVPIMEIIQRAVALKVGKIAIYHTHPEDNSLIFSKEDYIGRDLLKLYAKEFEIELYDDGIIDFTRNSYLSSDNNIYKCSINKQNEFKIIMNSIIPNISTLFLNRQGVNNIKSQILWR